MATRPVNFRDESFDGCLGVLQSANASVEPHRRFGTLNQNVTDASIETTGQAANDRSLAGVWIADDEVRVHQCLLKVTCFSQAWQHAHVV